MTSRCMEFGTPEAMWHLWVRDFPAIVTMDAHGNSLHKDLEAESAKKLEMLTVQHEVRGSIWSRSSSSGRRYPRSIAPWSRSMVARSTIARRGKGVGSRTSITFV